MTDSIERDQYNDFATLYDAIEELPQSTLYRQIVEYALKDCAGKTILDLGGGTGLHARKAIDLGASRVDLVDISKGMTDHGESIESKIGREDKIRWFVCDISEPMDHLPLDSGYDIVMVNWTFDHAETTEMLEAMWRNTAKYTKPGGKLISIKMANPYAESLQVGKYGVTFSDIKVIPGGVQYTYTAHTKPSLSVPATTMSASVDFEKAKKLAETHGFTDYQKVPETEMQCVKGDPEFWDMHLRDPAWICITAKKV